MKLKAPDGKTGELHLHGRSFPIKNGLVEVPDECISSKLWQDGYTVYQEPAKEKAVSETGKAEKA